MKKFLISLFLILIFAGFVYYRGLVSTAVPSGSWGVFDSQFKGIDEKPVQGGVWNWNWRWDKVLPTVVKVHIFDMSPFKTDLDAPITGDILPSGKDYASVLEGSVDFSFEFYYYIEFAPQPQSLPQLVSAGVTPEKLPTWSVEISRKLGEEISRFILRKPEILFQADYVEQIKLHVAAISELSALNIISLVPRKIQIPDYELYKFAKEKYLILQEQRFSSRIEQLKKEQERNILALDKEMEIIENIQEYGELLEKYPVLLDFLNLRNISIEDFVKLSQSRIDSKKQ